MGTYKLPRNVKGEGRILYIFSTKSLIYSGVGVLAGLVFYFIFSAINLKKFGIAIVIFLGVIGFIISTVKIPESNSTNLTRMLGGESLDDILKRYIKFKKNEKKLYILKKEED